MILSLVAAIGQAPPARAQAPAAAPIEMRGIGWIVLRSKDPDRLARFYAALGFQEWARSPRIIGFKAGGGAALEIGRLDADAPDQPPPDKRTQRQHTTIVGTKHAAQVAERAKAAGALFVETYMSGPVATYYVADPDGNVIGFAEDGPMWGNTDELRRVSDAVVAPGAK
ncbi:MAG: VOC family protein [Rhodospirillaceae bacterium]|nr:VOC family protein [Rhodospirillaceae bacterium]